MHTTRKENYTMTNKQLALMAKRANQRLREAEKRGYTNSPSYNAIRLGSLDNVQNIYSTTARGEIKFRTDPSQMTVEERKAIEKALNSYLNAETSTSIGYKRRADKIVNSFEQALVDEGGQYNRIPVRLESLMTAKNAMDVYRNKFMKDLNNMLGSEQVFDMYKQLSNDIRLSSDEVQEIFQSLSTKKDKLDKRLKSLDAIMRRLNKQREKIIQRKSNGRQSFTFTANDFTVE